MAYIFTPELNYYFYDYWRTRGDLQFADLKLPVIQDFSASLLPPNSFIELLFNNAYSYSTYNYGFSVFELKYQKEELFRRMFVIPRTTSGVSTYVTTDSTNYVNVYTIEAEDILLLDKLLLYRLGAPVDIIDIDINTLTKKLPRSIHRYLDMMINNNFDYFTTTNIETTISDTPLEQLFELYVFNEAHIIMKSWSTLIDSGEINLRPLRSINTVSASDSTNGFITILDVPYSTESDKIFLALNGNRIDFPNYSIASDSTSTTVTPVTTISEGDIIVVEYYKQV